MKSPEFKPDNQSGRMVNAPGFARLRTLNGWRADGIPEVLDAQGASVPVIGPFEIVEAVKVAEARTVILEALHADLYVPEVAGGLTHRDQKIRASVLNQLGRDGVCRPVGSRPEHRIWLLAVKQGEFTPAPAGSAVRMAGADAYRVPDGIRSLVGWVAGKPAILDRWTLPPSVTVVRSGRWKRPGSEDPRRWVELARAEVERANETDPEGVRALMLDRLAAEHAIVPAHEPERVLLELLAAEGYARRLDDTFVLAVEVGFDVP